MKLSKKQKEGDLVKLKSGSPKMTIEKIEEEYVNCTYYNQKVGEFVSRCFKKHELITVNQ